MNEVEAKNIVVLVGSKFIGQRSPMKTGTYHCTKSNNDYSVIQEQTEGAKDWKAIDSNLPASKNKRTIVFTKVTNRQNKELIDISVSDPSFLDLPLKANFAVIVNDKGFSKLDLKTSLTAKQLEKLVSEEVEA